MMVDRSEELCVVVFSDGSRSGPDTRIACEELIKFWGYYPGSSDPVIEAVEAVEKAKGEK